MRRSIGNKRKAVLFCLAFALLLQGEYVLADNCSAQAHALFNEAVALLNRTGGIASLETLPGTVPPIGMANPVPPEELGKILDTTISKLLKAIEIDPTVGGAYYFLGVAYLRKSERDEAIKAFYRALDMEPDRETTYILLCYLLWNANEYKQALDVTSRYAAQYPHSQITAAMLAGKTHFLMGDYRKALDYGLSIIALDRSRWEGPALAASSYYCLGDRKEAAEQWKVLETDPKTSRDVTRLKKDLEEKCGEMKGNGQ
jgi:tetratricopeptide (TPR) repeat protein